MQEENAGGIGSVVIYTGIAGSIQSNLELWLQNQPVFRSSGKIS